MKLDSKTGLIDEAQFYASPNFDERVHHETPEVLVVHSISLPPGKYQNNCVRDFFLNQLDPNLDDYFEQIASLNVSSHFFIKRSGELLQFVPTTKRAWHAGESVCLGKPMVNDFSIGIELEGWDESDDGYTDKQYLTLNELIDVLRHNYPEIANNLFAHSDIAPGRKTDPGPFFDWNRVGLR
jgi:AmpD protein